MERHNTMFLYVPRHTGLVENLISHSLSSLECMLGWNDELECTYITTPVHPVHTSQLSGAVTESVLSAFHVVLSPHKVFFHRSA